MPTGHRLPERTTLEMQAWIRIREQFFHFYRFQSLLMNQLTQRQASNRNANRTPSAREDNLRDASLDQNQRTVLPFLLLSITFDEVKYSVDMPQEMKGQGVTDDRLQLLKGTCGTFRAGVLTALMDVLARRKAGSYIEGNITISGYPKNKKLLLAHQDIVNKMISTLRISQFMNHCKYSAWLRLAAEVNSRARRTFIDEVMELVELTLLKEALVGTPGVNALSVEQQKRLTFAVELVTNPSVIFMDEPTSGLGARATAVVMRLIRNAVDAGRPVVCTIHQPRIDIFDAFDELLLMKRVAR